jgi:Tfp pilus assembly protein PilO
MIDRLSNRTAVVVAAVGVLAVALVGWFLLISPQRSKASELEGKITESRTALQLAEALNRSDARKETVAEARMLAKAMPDEASMSQILRQLSWAATRAKVRVNSVTPAAAAPLAGYEALPMTVVVEGRYPGVANFLGLIRKQTRVGPEKVRATGRLYSVDNVQFSGNSGESFLQATMTINAYRFGGAAAAAAPAGTAATASASTSAAPATAP